VQRACRCGCSAGSAVAYLFLAQLVRQNAAEVTRIARVAERHVGFQVVKMATGHT
jgi:acetolactate synthase regulatory subunit